MQEIYCENPREILANRQKLERELNVKLANKGKNIFIDGNPENEFIAIEILRAVNLGFSIVCALDLKKENHLLQIINIKDITKRKNLHEVRARIIGSNGRTLLTLKNLTDCSICIRDNQIGVIGEAEEIEDALQALTSLIQGSKQSNVYARLERLKKNKRIQGKLHIKNELE